MNWRSYAWLLVLGPALLASGCASAPNVRLQAAQSAVHALNQDPVVRRDAAPAADTAQATLQRAEQADDRAEATHRADIALLQVKIARADTRAAAARRRLEHLQQRIQTLQTRIDAAKAQRQRERAQAAQQRAQRQARETRAQARRQTARQRHAVIAGNHEAAQVATRLAQMRTQLAELSPKLDERGMVLTVGNALFSGDSAGLKPYTERIMDRLATLLKANPGSAVAVQGHTDNSGSAEANQKMSLARANAVTGALVKRGVMPARIQTAGLGERQPVASNDTAAGRRQNRRVEVIIRR